MNYHELARLCVNMHTALYVDHDNDAAKAYLSDLRSLLDDLPANDTSLVGAEAHAIYYELTGNIDQAIASRLREVDLMNQLYSDIRKNEYDERTKNALLAGRDEAAFRTREIIISSLRQRLK